MSGETEQNISGWTTDTLHSHVLRLLEERERRMEERFNAQSASVDAAFAAHEKARLLAWDASKAETQALREVVATRLDAALAAVGKAEEATEKRFASVNEFRQQLSDQTATFMPRPEIAALFAASAADRATLHVRLNELTTRMDRTEGQGKGLDKAWGYILGAIGAAAGLVALAYALAR